MNESDPSPRVPEFLHRRTVETMPFDTPYFLNTGLDEEHYSPTKSPLGIWINSESRLCVRKDDELDAEDQDIADYEMTGRIGLMRVENVDADGKIMCGYVADLRQVEPGSLDVDNGDAQPPDDPEIFNYWTKWMSNTVKIDAFACEEDDKITRYGDEKFYDSLEFLMQVVDDLPPMPDQETESTPEPTTRHDRLASTAKSVIRVLRQRVKPNQA